ncbi:calcium/proton antiporter [Asticcacaulis biprosthecium C19]|uniref:Calcium/proton antiporter n=1 Tax=Asticcacaulis biprosthecium C19 TaxID=715226 RepID=F4QP41_9CAUL|nr:calcium:proton antiporter [Asticcacaulis biprosthecium]EGF91099.1 calcium/proton antiporter [Asticcacaulis biprosthecium C19]
MLSLLRKELFLVIAAIVAVLAMLSEHSILHAGQGASLVAGIALIGVIIMASLRVAHHAEILAEKVGEPYGTMILTLSAVLVEVVILAIMLNGAPSPTLARDTIYSAVMLDINGIIGVAAILGGLKHGEQPYNDASGKTYIVMIMTGMGVSMLVPEFIPSPHWQAYSVFSIAIMVFLYGMFLRLQTTKHSYFFSYAYEAKGGEADHQDDHGGSKTWHSVAILITGIVLIGLLAEVMSKTLEVGMEGTGVPPIFSALVVATISASPEILTALRAALANRMQPVINIALGASLSTVVLTVPVIELLALIQGEKIIMALTPTQSIMTALTLLVAAINLNDGQTNAIEGTTHFVLFCAFLMLAFMGL